jgi:hypothetical protein
MKNATETAGWIYCTSIKAEISFVAEMTGGTIENKADVAGVNNRNMVEVVGVNTWYRYTGERQV